MLSVSLRRCMALAVIALAPAAWAQADVDALLKQLPAKDAATAAEVNAGLLAGGEAGVAALAQRLKPAGDNTDQPVRYALGGLSMHVARPGGPAEERVAFNAAVCSSIAGAPDDDARAFLIQLLHLPGDAACVPALAGYLGNARLAPDARLALEAIGGDAAAQALAGGPAAAAEYPHNTAIMEPPPAVEVFTNALAAAEGNAKWDVLVEGLESEFTSTRQAALGLVAKEFPGEQYTRRLGRLVKKAPQALRAEYLSAIGRRGDEAATKILSDYLEDEDENVRKAAVSALLIIKSPEADAAVKAWLAEAEPGEEATAAEKLVAASPGRDRILPEKDEDGYASIFNGQDLDNWTGWKRGYTVEDGAIVCKDASLNLYTKREYANFSLRFEFKLTPAANNGVGIRAPLKGKASEEGMEIQVLDEDHLDYKDIHDYQVHGSVYGLIPAKRGFLKPTGEWNAQEITVDGSHITVVLNGETILDADLVETLAKGALDGKEHTGAARASGHIGFLGHGDTVYYRNLRVKELP